MKRRVTGQHPCKRASVECIFTFFLAHYAVRILCFFWLNFVEEQQYNYYFYARVCCIVFWHILVCQETLPILENVENISGQKPTTLAKKIETVESHDVERTLFDALNHECRAKIVFSGCALGADRSWSSTVSHDRTASYRHHDSRPSHFFFFFFGQVVEAQCRNKKKPGEVQAWTIRHQIAQPIRSTMLYRLSQIPVYMYKKGSLVNLGGGFPIDTEDHGGCWQRTNKNRMVRAQASPGFFHGIGVLGFCVEKFLSMCCCHTQANPSHFRICVWQGRKYSSFCLHIQGIE